jgi:prepilin peptidase CpaA
MLSHLSHLLWMLPLLLMLIWTAIEDIRVRRIRNWLTFSMLISGLAESLLPGSHLGFEQSLLGFGAGFLIPFILFVLGAVGGGDVKLLAAIGAWVGAVASFKVYCLQAILGMIIVLVQAAWQGTLLKLGRNSAMLAVNLIHLEQVGIEHASLTGQSCRSVERPLPFAVPVLMAVVILALLGQV